MFIAFLQCVLLVWNERIHCAKLDFFVYKKFIIFLCRKREKIILKNKTSYPIAIIQVIHRVIHIFVDNQALIFCVKSDRTVCISKSSLAKSPILSQA